MEENGGFVLEARFFSYSTYSRRSNEQEVKCCGRVYTLSSARFQLRRVFQ